jgi:hypothetical protein
VCPGYGAVMASAGLAVLEVEIVFHAELPSVEQSSSSVVALLALVQVLAAGETAKSRAPLNPFPVTPSPVLVGASSSASS